MALELYGKLSILFFAKYFLFLKYNSLQTNQNISCLENKNYDVYEKYLVNTNTLSKRIFFMIMNNFDNIMS